jgi:hypothetical protein
VLSADGSGSITSPTSPSPSAVQASSSGNTISFTYTAATGGMQNGTVSFAVPSGWSAPSTLPANAGYTTATSPSGPLTVGVSGRTVNVSGITLFEGGTVTIKYGDTVGGGLGATAPITTGPQTWTTKQRSNSNGTLTLLTSSPQPSVLVHP